MRDLYPYDRALSWLLDRCSPVVRSARVSVEDALGRRLSDTPTAVTAMPPIDTATRDGMPVVAARTQGASSYNPVADCGVGSSLRAGDGLPAGADAVAHADVIDTQGSVATVVAEVDTGDGVCRAGQFRRQGQLLLDGRRPLSAADVVSLAAQRTQDVCVFEDPRVAVICARSDGPAMTAPQVFMDQFCRNLAQVSWHSFTSSPRPGENERRVLAAVADHTDLLVLLCSPGEGNSGMAADLVSRLGHLEAFPVAVCPATFMAVGSINDVPVVVVPGAPVSAMAALQLLVRPGLDALRGDKAADGMPRAEGRLAQKVTSTLGVVDYVRVRLDGDTAHPRRISTDLDPTALSDTDGYMLVDADSEGFPAGQIVPIHLDEI